MGHDVMGIVFRVHEEGRRHPIFFVWCSSFNHTIVAAPDARAIILCAHMKENAGIGALMLDAYVTTLLQTLFAAKCAQNSPH